VPGYELLEELGRGGVGIVYKARDLRLGRVVALKVVRSGVLDGPEDAVRFRREAELAARLQHPNLVAIYEVGEWEELSYLALEYVPGVTLRQKLAGEPQPPAEAAALVQTLARAMQHAHERGVVHRDLKPGNVLLAGPVGTGVQVCPDRPGGPPPQWAPKITDFGMARHLTEGQPHTRTGEVLGTPSYMAPEQARGTSQQAGPAADVYALGAVLYECLTGHPPFQSPAVLTTLALVVAADPVAPRQLVPGVPRDLETICLKCLQKPPERRYASAAELADDLSRFLEGRPIHARPVGRAERAWRWCRRHPREAALGALAALGLGLALGGWLWLAQVRADRAEQEARELHERARTVRAVHQALDEAGQLHRGAGGAPEKLTEALAAARRAHALLPQGEEELRGRVERALKQIALEERTAREKAAQAALDLRTVRALEEALYGIPTAQGDARVAQSEKALQSAFEGHGLDLDRLPPEQAAARIKASAIRQALMGGLDAWLLARKLAGKDWKRLREVARRADPDPLRNRLRDALVRDDFEAIQRVGEEMVESEQPTATLEMIGPYLRVKGGNDRALAVLRAAHVRHPADFTLNFELARCCLEVAPPRLDESIRYLTAALAVRPHPWLQYQLALALSKRGDSDEVIDRVRQALAGLPDNLEAHELLADQLLARGVIDEALVPLRVLAAKRPSAVVWFNLGLTQLNIGHLAEADDACRKAVALDPKAAHAHLTHAHVLQLQGRLDDALASVERALALAHAPDQKQIANFQAQNVRRLLAVAGKVPDVRAGKLRPVGRERLDLADLCAARGMSVTAARLFREALEAGDTAGRPVSSFRYTAGLTAVAAGLGRGNEGAGLGEEERARWRRQGLAWLREQVAWYGSVPKKTPEDWRLTEMGLRRFRCDPLLAPLRQPEALGRLPAAEREPWRQFWAEVEVQIKRCRRR
jgi:serine/threonine-protein kinase